jgi:RNA polymerase sigma-70 factor, ECF subfamily
VALSNLDRDLLRDCLAREPDAWVQFTDRFIGLVAHVVQHTAVMRQIHLSQELRDDLVADVFLAWIDNDFAILRRFQGRSSLATYLAVVARRIVARRLAQLRLPASHGSLDSVPSEPASEDDQERYTKEDIEQLEKSIDRLSQHEATAVRMFHFEGKSYQEIGSHLGMAENSIGPFLSRARDKIRRTV